MKKKREDGSRYFYAPKGENLMKKRMRMTMKIEKTFKDGCEDYLLDCKARNLREGTLKHYTDVIKQLYKYIPADTPIAEINSETFKNFIIELRNREDINSQSLNTYARDLKTILYFFMRQEYIPTVKLNVPKVDKTPVETYTDSELQKLLKKPNLKQCTFTEYKMWVMTNFLLSTGVRQKSLLNIKIEDLDFDSELINISHTKNRKALIIPMNSDIKKILQEYLKHRGGERRDYLFCNIYGKQLAKSTLIHTLMEYNHNRGVERTGTHRYRHTFAKKWVLMNGNLVTLQKVLGHSSLQMTQNYINLLVSDMKKDIEEFNVLREFKRESIKIGA